MRLRSITGTLISDVFMCLASQASSSGGLTKISGTFRKPESIRPLTPAFVSSKAFSILIRSSDGGVNSYTINHSLVKPNFVQGQHVEVITKQEETERSWDLHTLHSLFTAAEIEAILKIKGLDPTGEDRLIWYGDPKGKCAVSTVYSSLIESCGKEVETLEHLLFHCPRALSIWKLSPVRWDGVSLDTSSFRGWWTQLCSLDNSPISNDCLQLTAYLLWEIWKSKNHWIFQNSRKPENLEAPDLILQENCQKRRVCVLTGADGYVWLGTNRVIVPEKSAIPATFQGSQISGNSTGSILPKFCTEIANVSLQLAARDRYRSILLPNLTFRVISRVLNSFFTSPSCSWNFLIPSSILSRTSRDIP
ncbi:ribonuclease H-like superfamily protein [Striga asiatica]|uniref:Ribonuclease H-like superfamily protein n=1 Tax=Striga asiatica TaxID=4170 RepID=A0A5A7R4D1_STRAF|nr:ribonuclease H-like superfamily protein [Striga asiatica]